MYFVVAGGIEVQMPGRKLRFSTGVFFGELALLKDTIRETSIIAVRSTRLLSLSSNDFDGLLHKRRDLQRQISKLATEEAEDAVRLLSQEELREADPV